MAKVNLKLSFGPKRPESQTPVSETMSCVIESVFDQVTTEACVTFAGLGANAVVVKLRAFGGMLTAAAGPDGAGEGAGDGAGDGVEGVGDGADGVLGEE